MRRNLAVAERGKAMTVFWYVMALIEGLIALIQLIAGGDASQATLLSVLSIIVGKVEELGKGTKK